MSVEVQRGELAGAEAARRAKNSSLFSGPIRRVYDGRFANNGWLQELPKPVTKLTWDNAALVSPKTAEKLALTHRVAARGGEHGQILSNVIDIALSNSKVTAAAWILPGQADGVIVLPLGYGRKNAGYTGTNKGFNAYAVRTSDALWIAAGGKISKTGDDYPLACTQYHFNMEGRKILSTGTLEEYKKNPAFAHEGDETPPKRRFAVQGIRLPRLCLGHGHRPEQLQRLQRLRGGLRVGKQHSGRRQRSGDARPRNALDPHRSLLHKRRPARNDPSDRRERSRWTIRPTFFQPVPCQQCENAPCEQVCPVGATVHSAEGLNDMVYNRCVGTRYCSNNCPYKVRRFNFLRFQDWETPQLKLLRNPEVTVRSRGVMEKCTYCVQRINNARIEAEKQNRPIRDGEIVTACEAACPSKPSSSATPTIRTAAWPN